MTSGTESRVNNRKVKWWTFVSFDAYNLIVFNKNRLVHECRSNQTNTLISMDNNSVGYSHSRHWHTILHIVRVNWMREKWETKICHERCIRIQSKRLTHVIYCSQLYQHRCDDKTFVCTNRTIISAAVYLHLNNMKNSASTMCLLRTRTGWYKRYKNVFLIFLFNFRTTNCEKLHNSVDRL